MRDVEGFIQRAGWTDAARMPLTSDWSPRKYTRLAMAGGRTAILLQGPEPEIPGHALADFVSLSERLRAKGLSAPAIIAADLPQHFLLLEDFGDTPIDTPAIEHSAYEAAVDALAVLRTLPCNDLTAYADGYIYKKLALFSTDTEWMVGWARAQATLPPCPHVFGHMDYKAGNLHWLPERTGAARIGILDFQAAQRAPFVYDIVNLLEDARRTLDDGFKASLKARFKAALPPTWAEIFDEWYALTAAQFHARVLGQIRGNPAIAPDIAPRLIEYLRAERTHAALAPLKPFLDPL